MNPIRIDIRPEDFNGEFHADIALSHDKVEYIASDDIETLLKLIMGIVFKYHQGTNK